MNEPSSSPTTARAKFVYLLWRNLPRLFLLGMIVLIFVLFGLIGEEKKRITTEKAAAISRERPPVNAVLMEIHPTVITDRINLPGLIEPWTTLELMARLGGTVDKVLVREGDEVQKGDILARLEDDDARIALDAARAAYSLTKSEYRRDKTVHDKGVLPIAVLDAKETAMRMAKAEVENAELFLSRCTITAPMSGVIRRLDAKVGLLLQLGDPIGQILKIDQVKAVIGIPASDVTPVRSLNEVALTVQALDNRMITGTKHFLSASPETNARLYRLELAIDNSGREILPGMFVRGDVVKKISANSVAVPLYSVITRNNEQFVFVEEDGVARKKNIKLGIMEKWRVQVTQGLSPGDRVLVEGHRDVEDGQKIKVVDVISNPPVDKP